MNSDSIPIFVVLLILIFLSAFFSATETAFSSLNKIRIKTLAADGNKKARLVSKFVDNYDRLLSTVLIGNNIVNITASSLATVLFTKYLLPASEGTAVTLSTVVLTVVILIFGEITPKTLAKENPEKYAMAIAGVVRFIYILLYPVNIIFVGWKKLLKKMFRIQSDQGITEEELLTIVDEAEKNGDLSGEETELISSAIEFNDRDVGDIIIPRVNVIAVEKTTPMEEIKKIFLEYEFSRLPVYDGSIDKIVGMIHEKDFYTVYFNLEKNIDRIIQKVVFTTPHMKISMLLSKLQREKVHLAIVTDEYGGTLGLVTMEDILEELVGEIWDEHDDVITYFQKQEEGVYLVDGNAPLHELFELIDFKTQEEFEATTVGGWVTEMMEAIPVAGEGFDYENLHIDITKTDARRVIEVRLTVNEKAEEEDDGARPLKLFDRDKDKEKDDDKRDKDNKKDKDDEKDKDGE